ncbi:hypothetical protein MMC18_003615 [Xylographa bjoerkii]|nr:hypothetical protein [Xylographa bjoerkii]
MSSDLLPLKALINAKGGDIDLNTLIDCDEVFVVPYQPDETTIEILGNLWLDGNEILPRAIESRQLNARNSSATSEAYKDLYTTMIFHGQDHDPATKPLLVRRYGEPALQKTDRKPEQPLPPIVRAKNCKSHSSSTSEFVTRKTSGPSVSTSSKSKTAQHPNPGPPHHGARKAIEERNPFKKVSKDTGISGSSMGQTTTAEVTTADPYTDSVVDVQYWLSEGILEPGLQKRANDHVPKLFNESRFYAPYLTVLVVKSAADIEEYRHKLIAASSICLYQTHCLFESSEKIQTQVTQEAGSELSSTSQKESTRQKEYKQRNKFHFGILMGELDFEVFQLRPKFVNGTTKWDGFNATLVAVISLKTLDEIRVLLHWVSSIHWWGVTKHLAHFQTDLAKFRDSHAARHSLVAEF